MIHTIQYALAATEQAVKDSEIDLSKETPTDMGVLIASGTGGVTSLIDNVMLTEKRGLRKVSPFLIPNMLVDSAAGKIAIVYNMRGPNFSVVNACASGTAATGEAFELIRRGDAQVMVTGGAEAALLPVLMAGFDIMGAMSQRNDEPAAACRPFDTDRDGFVMSEGSAILILELLEHALARDARIYAEIIGYGNSADAYHMAAPHFNGQGAEDAMEMALRKADGYGVKRTDVDYVNAHGTGTELNDPGETKAIKRVLGEHAYNVNVSSTKSMLGHLLGAAGAIEAIVCLKTIDDGVIPPTINLVNPDPSCDLNYTPLRSVQADVGVTMSNSFGFRRPQLMSDVAAVRGEWGMTAQAHEENGTGSDYAAPHLNGDYKAEEAQQQMQDRVQPPCYAQIIGWGYQVPERVVTNHDLEQVVDTQDEWIRTRTGIQERRVVATGGGDHGLSGNGGGSQSS